jgi:Chromo (CHRromatin Organisation MOdifier) domain
MTEIVGDSQIAFKLDLPPAMRIHPVFHGSFLEPYHANAIPGRTQPAPPAVEVEGQDEYEVEDILDSKILRNRPYYFMDWVGYSRTDRTWEPAEQLEHVPEMVARYHTRYPQRPNANDIRATRST